MDYLKLLSQPTYQAGLLQSQAYRTLNSFLTAQLSEYGVSVPEWSCLGLISITKDSIRPSEIAKELGIKQPVCTVLIKQLLGKGLIERQLDRQDNRVSNIIITQNGKELTAAAERHLRGKMQLFLGDIDRRDLATYVHVLAKIAKKDAGLNV